MAMRTLAADPFVHQFTRSPQATIASVVVPDMDTVNVRLGTKTSGSVLQFNVSCNRLHMRNSENQKIPNPKFQILLTLQASVPNLLQKMPGLKVGEA